MDALIQEDKTFENEDFSEKKLNVKDFDNCTFINCNFSKTDLSDINFLDCLFKGSNCSLAIVNNTGIKNIRFEDCKIMGIDFGVCNDFLFSANFNNCQLDYSSFYKKKMKKAIFSNCSLKEADFTETDLSGAFFKNCELQHTIFMQTVLEKADFRTARNYAFDPELNKIRKAKFSYPDVAGLLSKYNIEIE